MDGQNTLHIRLTIHLINRDFEWELMPLAIDQKIGTIVWSPLASGMLSGKYRRNQPMPQNARVAQGGSPIPGEAINNERLYNIIDRLDAIAKETGKTVAQVSLNWLLQRPTVSNIIIGARNEEQLKQNLDAVGWNLTLDQVKSLDEASEIFPAYPYWHQRQFPLLNAAPKLYGDKTGIISSTFNPSGYRRLRKWPPVQPADFILKPFGLATPRTRHFTEIQFDVLNTSNLIKFNPRSPSVQIPGFTGGYSN